MTGSRLRAAPFLCPPLPLSPGRPPPTPSFHRSFLPAGSLSKAPPAPAPSTSPLCCLFLPAGPLPKVPPVPPAPRLVGTPFSWRGPIPATSPAPTSPGPHFASAPSSWWGTLPQAPPTPPLQTPLHHHPFLPAGNTRKISFHIVPPLSGGLSPPSPLSKTDLEGRLSAPPGRAQAFLGSFRAFSGTFWAFPGVF